MNDRRKKGCPNEKCIQHINKVKHNSEIDYCPKCGTKLIFVCVKCFNEIEDIDPKHYICIRCKTEAEEKRAQVIDKGKDIAIKYVVPIGAGILAGAQKDVINKVTKAIKNVADTIIKK